MISFLMTRIDKIQNELSKIVSLHAQLTGQLAEAKYILEQYNNIKSESSHEIKQDDIQDEEK